MMYILVWFMCDLICSLEGQFKCLVTGPSSNNWYIALKHVFQIHKVFGALMVVTKVANSQLVGPSIPRTRSSLIDSPAK